ncbi:hypothetical protein Nepgr_016555 [Nepenthes gracilis]|uniref:Uncharacterized protein n=1 Tax=Nepenthes gracilis TaxID=150966 RepID=A0AAD3XS81_NEPGR|nr:hypothetical protein Nepgr_016555 [Nepenthes gracilis]
MITKSKLVEQLFNDYHSRSQRKYPAIAIFSPKPFLTSWYRNGCSPHLTSVNPDLSAIVGDKMPPLVAVKSQKSLREPLSWLKR